jgi:ribosomal protein S6--L-glutamate ligase
MIHDRRDDTMTLKTKKIITLEARLAGFPDVITLGVKPNFYDYEPEAAELIREARRIYYPAVFYAELFDSMGKSTFPGYHTYKCVQDKIKQTALFNLLDIPHPKTRVFYGKRQKTKIGEYFKYPMICKVPRGSAMGRGVYLINSDDELKAYCDKEHVAYVQEYLPIDRDIRVVVIGSKAVHAYWRIAPDDDFRSNVAVGGTIRLDKVPAEAIELALHVARSCRWDDVGIDICQYQGRYYILEANMKYGKEGFRQAGIDYKEMVVNMIRNNEI